MSFYRLDKITFSYPEGKNIFDTYSLEIQQNEAVGLAGSNGAGKTTLVKLMAGILKPKSGQIFLNNNNINRLSLAQIGRKAGFCFQNADSQLFAPTVYEQLAFGIRQIEKDESVVKEKVRYWLDYFELNKYINELPFYLSMGQKQRVIIAAAMIRGTDFIIMDEPTTGLDTQSIKKLDESIQSLREKGKGCMLISHDKKFISRHTDRLITLENRRSRSEQN